MGSMYKPRRLGFAPRVAATAMAAMVAVAVLGPAAGAGPSDAHGSTFVLTDFHFDTKVLSGRNNQGGSFTNHDGGSFSAPYDAETWFRTAKLDRYTPVDPCREKATQYNDAISAGSFDPETGSWAPGPGASPALDFALDGLVEAGCSARVIIPGDPCRCLPPSPIRQFEPRALPPNPT